MNGTAEDETLDLGGNSMVHNFTRLETRAAQRA